MFLDRLLGKEIKNATDAMAMVQGRSSGRERSRNIGNSFSHTDDYYTDEVIGGELDEEGGDSSHGAKGILSGTSEWLLSSSTSSGGTSTRGAYS